MEEGELSILQREGDYLCKEVANSGYFANIVYELMTREVLSPEFAKGLLESEERKTIKMLKLLDYLKKGNSETFEILIELLIQYGLSSVVKRLDPRAFEHHRSPIGDSNDKLDAERYPDLDRTGELHAASPMFNLPSLPRRSSSSSSIPESDRNGNEKYDPTKPLVVNVLPAQVLGGSHFDKSELYKNESMPRGLVFLANYKNFRNEENPVNSINDERKGSQKDVTHLCNLFTQMGYKIPEVHLNLSKYDTIKALREFRNNEEHKNVDSCIVVIMSHGRDGKSFYTSDNQHLTINDVVERFSNSECEYLRGKPKIFIFQYCRGTVPDIGVVPTPVVHKDAGLPVETDASYTSVVDRDPTFSDMYIVYSTVEGFASFRHPERGSWLMEAICNVFMRYSHLEELDSLMKRVSRQVRGNYSDEGNKQVCEYVQRGFDRHFYFNPRPLNST
ncbi:caspase-3-like [Palaemon carinicauda]|uniref:caspase-3-like n=1 Tax=Palaemon carinicauda TaxID=392227 RepID=UPI0035B64063